MRYLLLALLLIPSVLGATISGTVYDIYFEESQAIIEINTSPPQKMVAKGGFSFEVPEGTYLMNATQITTEGLAISAEEEITVGSEGEFVRDIVLMDSFDFQDDFDPASDLEDFDFEIPFEEENKPNYLWVVVTCIVAFLLIALTIWKSRKKPSAKPSPTKNTKEVLKFIQEEKETTQKEIRQKFPFSEAKVSLIIRELESQGRIEKVKKGRANVIKIK